MKYFPFFLALLLILSPSVASAVAFGGFVTCEGAGCSACNLVDMINIIIKWLLGFVFVIFAVLMTSAGFGLVTSGGNQSALDEAKSKFQNAIVGIIIIMAAWLIVDTVMKGLLSGGAGVISGWGPWSEVQCQVQRAPDPWSRRGNDIPVPGEVTPPSTTSGSLAHSAAVAQLGSGFTVTSSGSCSDKTQTKCTSLDGIKENTIQRVKELQVAIGVPLVVTGGTEAGHAAGPYSHANGYKIDLQVQPALNSYISNNFTSIGSNKWKDSKGNVYMRHGPPDHWDLLLTN